MTPKQFQKYLDRDKFCCHCGSTEALVPHHRKNRGMGGAGVCRNLPSNILTVCAQLNLLMESDSNTAEQARNYGWKLLSWQDPSSEPYYNAMTGEWILLDDVYQTQIIKR
jgi:hypothetical protein